MYWIIVFGATVLGAIVQIVLAPTGSSSLAGAAEIALVWFVAGFYGLGTLLAGLQHLLNADKIAAYIGWAPGSGFQLELGWAEVGLGLAGILALWLRGSYLLGPALVGTLLYLGAAGVHARDMRMHGNSNPGSAGPVFYIDILAPLIVIVLLVLTTPWSR